MTSIAELEDTWKCELMESWDGDPLAVQKLASVARCNAGGYTLVLWPKGHLGDTQVKFELCEVFCKSWRCPRCAYGVAMQDLRRLQAAVTSRSWWLYAVLTFDRRADDSDPWLAYKRAGLQWNNRLAKRLARRFGRLEYVQTWEAHADGWPHVNLLMTSPGLRADVEQYDDELREVESHGRKRMAHWTAWRSYRLDARGERDKFESWSTSAGFGERTWIEIVDSREGMACYLAKVAREIGSTIWKRKKGGLDQRPLNAPPHFRRIRASRGLLPERQAELRWNSLDHWHVLPKGESQYEGVLLREPIAHVDPGAITWSKLLPLISRIA